MNVPNSSRSADRIPSVENLTSREQGIVGDLLFSREVSRNQQFDRFSAPQTQRLHRIAKHLRALRKELARPDGDYWIEELSDTVLCLHIHRPAVGLFRRVFLSLGEWELLDDPRWDAA